MDRLASLVAFMFLTVSSAWATTTAPGGGAGSAPAGGAGTTGTGGGIGDYWWIILVALAALAIWYFMRSRRNKTGL